MKRVKIMLLSLALFAVVGAALAFKARFIQNYCTAPTINGACPVYCPNLVRSSTTTASVPFVCTTTPTTWLDGTVVRSTCFIDNDPSQTLLCTVTTTKLTIDNIPE